MIDVDLIPETGECSRNFNEREFVAKQIARADGRAWHAIPNVSSWWFRDRMHYRHLAERALAAKRLWDTYLKYQTAKASAEEKAA